MGLLQNVFGLNGGRFGERDQSVGERRIEVRLGDIEAKLRALRGQLDFRRAATGVSDIVLRIDASTREQILREGKTKVVLILGAESEAAEG